MTTSISEPESESKSDIAFAKAKFRSGIRSRHCRRDRGDPSAVGFEKEKLGCLGCGAPAADVGDKYLDDSQYIHILRIVLLTGSVHHYRHR